MSDNDNASEQTMEDLEIASMNSIWEKLEPPVRRSPKPCMSAMIIGIEPGNGSAEPDNASAASVAGDDDAVTTGTKLDAPRPTAGKAGPH